MNVVFLTMSNIQSIDRRGIYSDLMRKFRDEGHNVYIISDLERRLGQRTMLSSIDGVNILGVRTLNVQKTNVLEKGIGQLSMGMLYKRAIRRFLGDVPVDLILYSTPPITLVNVVKYLKLRNLNSKTYLLLKDIFPQNAVDMGMMTKSGVKGIVYKYFRKQEKALYEISDFIGCMSPANVEYILRENPSIPPSKVEIAPNSVDLQQLMPSTTSENRNAFLGKLNIPTDKTLIVYGGNLGKPQGIDFLLKCLDANKGRTDCHFVIVGSGVEYGKISQWVEASDTKSVTLIKLLPKNEYDTLLRFCDIGMVFLDFRFTIPNFPSRLLSYMENKMPVIVCSDVVSDMGRIAENNGFGFWVPSNDEKKFSDALDRILAADYGKMGNLGYAYMTGHYLIEHTYDPIIKHFGPSERP